MAHGGYVKRRVKPAAGRRSRTGGLGVEKKPKSASLKNQIRSVERMLRKVLPLSLSLPLCSIFTYFDYLKLPLGFALVGVVFMVCEFEFCASFLCFSAYNTIGSGWLCYWEELLCCNLSCSRSMLVKVRFVCSESVGKLTIFKFCPSLGCPWKHEPGKNYLDLNVTVGSFFL